MLTVAADRDGCLKIRRSLSGPDSWRQRPLPVSRDGSRGVRPHLHQHLSEIVPAQHLGETGGYDLDALSNVFAVSYLSRPHQGGHPRKKAF
jgi:hypothetical protein